MIIDRVLDGVKGQNILVLSDSNGSIGEGWVNQLREKRFSDFIYNTSISGNTIGFDNNGNKEQNTLRQVNRYMNEAGKALNGMNKIFIMLGTNDCKAVYNDSLKLVPQNMKILIEKMKAHPIYQKYHPEIFVITPPPYCIGKGTDYLQSGKQPKYTKLTLAWGKYLKNARIIRKGNNTLDKYILGKPSETDLAISLSRVSGSGGVNQYL